MTSETGEPVSDADHVTLERLATEVNWRVDAGIAESIPELFTADGSIATFGEPSVGHEALAAWGRMMDTDKPLAGVRHVLTNFRFTTDGPGRVTGTFYVTAYLPGAPAGQGTVPFAMGQCTDHYRRTEQGWKVASRVFEPFFLRDQAA
ncbi:nuclear transport factor 2 family protein [Streptomyces sp. NPDC003737]|uniref:nuclear transport factor 2 family protein n=1 Tax=Streptomyces sp. NPDC003737 TaxID=3364685 RepID=UPI0036766490